MLGEPLRTTAEVKSGAATPTFSGILGRVPAQGNILPQTTATDVLADHYPEARGQGPGSGDPQDSPGGRRGLEGSHGEGTLPGRVFRGVGHWRWDLGASESPGKMGGPRRRGHLT